MAKNECRIKRSSPRAHQFLKTSLLAGTTLSLILGVASAADNNNHSDSGLEARVNALEDKLDKILDRLEAQDTRLTQTEAQTLRDASKVIAGTAPSTPQPVLVELQTPGGVSAQNVKPSEKKSGYGFSVGDTNFTFKGFIKLDASVSDFSGGDLPTNSLGRDFYIPGLVPVGGESNGPDFDFNPRETRFIFAMDSERGGHDIGGLIELDFQVTSDGNERVSNSFTPRMRQAYITFDNWLLGQTWSTFQDVSALPDNLDFIGPTEGTVFVRQPMIRYSNGPWQIALEQPETEITGPSGERLLPGTISPQTLWFATIITRLGSLNACRHWSRSTCRR